MLDELYEKVKDLYDAVEEMSLINNSGEYLNETENYINEAYRKVIARICNIDEQDVTYGMIDLARNYLVYDEVNGVRKSRHLTNQEYAKEVGRMLGKDDNKAPVIKDRIGKLYDTISDNITAIRDLGVPEDEVFTYMNELTADIYRNTIAEITGLYPEVIPDEFIYNIACCVKLDENGNLKIEKYTDPEIVIAAKESGLYDKRIYVFPGEYNHGVAGKIERLDSACRDHYEDLNKLGVRHDEVVTFMKGLTDDLYRETLAEVLDEPLENISDDLVETIRRGKTSLDGSRKSYLDNEIRLLFAYNKSKNKTM